MKGGKETKKKEKTTIKDVFGIIIVILAVCNIFYIVFKDTAHLPILIFMIVVFIVIGFIGFFRKKQ